MRANLQKAENRAKQKAQRTAAWRAANTHGRAAIEGRARKQADSEAYVLCYILIDERGIQADNLERRAEYQHWRVAAAEMGFRADDKSFAWKEGCAKYGAVAAAAAAESLDEEEEEGEEELPFSLPDDEPSKSTRSGNP